MVSIWHPEPPPWFESFSTSSTALEPPIPNTDDTPEIIERQTFGSCEVAPPPYIEEDSDIKIKDELIRLKESVVEKFKEMFVLIGNSDPADSKNPERIDTLHTEIESDVAKFHEHIRSYRRHQGVENIIQLLELEINDYTRAIDELGKAQSSLHDAIVLKK